MSDQVYYSDSLEAQQWLIYYISRPLVGSYEHIKITPAALPGLGNNLKVQEDVSNANASARRDSGSSSTEKKDIQTFHELLNSFPMIARQMQPGLEKVFNDFKAGLESWSTNKVKEDINRPRRSSTTSTKSNGSIHSRYSNGNPVLPSHGIKTRGDQELDHLRVTLETAVTAAIDLFQQVDKQQLSFLGSTTDLTGPTVERLIERYVAEQLHESILFPRICNSKRLEDLELEARIHSMQYIDIAQVGIAIENGRAGKEQLMNRVAKGVEELRMLTVAGSPQMMMDILLQTQKLVASDQDTPKEQEITSGHLENPKSSEKVSSAMMMNADTLVSLLLVVVIQSQVRNLHARLTYMRDFMFCDNIESGELGYALSTFEAVLSYLATDSGGLRKASRRNKRLWQATRGGDLLEVKVILDPDWGETSKSGFGDGTDANAVLDEEPDQDWGQKVVIGSANGHGEQDWGTSNDDGYVSEGSTLAHVFPFQAIKAPRKVKRVSMDARSFSNSSEMSFGSRTTTLDSRSSVIESDTSIATLAQTQNIDRDSILMMAVESRQPEVLDYLLSLEDYFPHRHVMEDSNKDGTTLLSAAVQLVHDELVDSILRRIERTREKTDIVSYLARPDNQGRTVAHYIFNAPRLISRFGIILPWKTRDKNGQTPLLAVCRSYDHPDYLAMVNNSIQFATHAQGDGQPLHLDDHIDSKGNTLLHAVSDPSLAVRILRQCDTDANAVNDKRFTPLMVASKYGRMDMVRAFFGDTRVDILVKESRGMTAVELAKDDGIRNHIDDLVLVSNVPAPDRRVTAVVRSFFVEDASVRMIIKSAVRNADGMIGVTTCRRSLTDFENLAKWLSLEHPASWLPSIFNFRSPFQIASRPSRAVLQDIQVRLDRFLKIMLAHSTFSTHELLWEFILFPEIQPDMMAERSSKKAEIRNENIREDYEPVEDIREVSRFMEHARDSIRGIDHFSRSVTRRVINVQVGLSSESHLLSLCSTINVARLLRRHESLRGVFRNITGPSTCSYQRSEPDRLMCPSGPVRPTQTFPAGHARNNLYCPGDSVLVSSTSFFDQLHGQRTESH